MKRNLRKPIRKIDGRLDIIDNDMRVLKDKVNEAEESTRRIEDANVRMDERLVALEREMKRSTLLREKSDKLRNTLTLQPTGSVSIQDQVLDKETSSKNQRRDKELKEGNDYSSEWAKELQEELTQAAEIRLRKHEGEEHRQREVRSTQESSRPGIQPVGRAAPDRQVRQDRQVYAPDRQVRQDRQIFEKNSLDDQQEQEVPDRWEELLPKPLKPKIRKPMEIMEWFGFQSETESSDSSDDGEWTEVDRRKRSEDKKKLQKKKKKEMEALTAAKAANIIGVGPVDMSILDKHKNESISYKRCKILAVEDFLMKYLDYDREELDELTIAETRLAATENIIYIAFTEQEQVRELHMRKAEMKNDMITIRNYIPPTFYDRFTFLNGVCRDKRMEDKDLKTQLRFRKKDLEIYVKYRGENAPFRQIKLEDFTDMSVVPPFNHNIKWRWYEEKSPRRRRGQQVDRQRKLTDEPATGEILPQRTPPGPPIQAHIGRNVNTVEQTSLIRQHSESSDKDMEHKKPRVNSTTSEDEDMEDDDEEDESDLEGSGSGRKE